ELVENGDLDLGDDNAKKKENQKRDAKALFFIQQAVDESIFSRIATATTSEQAWSILKTEFQGSSKVITVKLQSLRREFETSNIKGNESVQEYLARILAIVSQMRSYGETISDETIVAKVLRSLDPKFDHVVAAIEESKDLSKFTFGELMGSLQAHEVRINRSPGKEEEKAFQVKGGSDFSSSRGRGRGCGGFRGRGRGRGRNSSLQCSFCGKSGHSEKYYKSVRSRVRLGDDKQLHIEGCGTVILTIGDNGLPFIKDQKKVCEGCVLGKQAKKSFPVGNSRRATEVLKLVHADLCGPMKSESLSGSRTQVLMNYLQLSHLIYVEVSVITFLEDQPRGFEDVSCPDKVFRLKKALYELKHALRAYNKIDEFFQKEGSEKSNLYVKKEEYTPTNPEEKFQAEDGTQLAEGGKYQSLIGRVTPSNWVAAKYGFESVTS
nr:UBN2 domain-containing protein [Tanacetum cinerariifolium]